VAGGWITAARCGHRSPGRRFLHGVGVVRHARPTGLQHWSSARGGVPPSAFQLAHLSANSRPSERTHPPRSRRGLGRQWSGEVAVVRSPNNCRERVFLHRRPNDCPERVFPCRSGNDCPGAAATGQSGPRSGVLPVGRLPLPRRRAGRGSNKAARRMRAVTRGMGGKC
jgi:hypothetical protein